MQVVHTAAEPPNQGRISFDARGCTRNRRQALESIVLPKKTGNGTAARVAPTALVERVSLTKLDTGKRLLGRARFPQGVITW
jgi:hypothetical protein